MTSMSSVLREKIALVVFVALVVLGLGALTWYLSVGKNWNYAAATIDESTGQMEGYVAVLYQGTVLEEVPKEKAADTSNTQSNKKSDLQTDTIIDSASRNVEDSSSVDTETNDVVPNSLASKSPGKLVEETPVTIEDVAKSYEEKGASVYTLDVSNPSQYSDGIIVRKGNQRFGVLSVALMDSGVAVQEKIDYFTEHHVNFVIVLVPNKHVVQNLKDIDVVVTTNNKELTNFGETSSGTFYVNTPLIGSVGMTLVSPHNVVSAKVIQEL